jgi:hypothetical protein
MHREQLLYEMGESVEVNWLLWFCCQLGFLYLETVFHYTSGCSDKDMFICLDYESMKCRGGKKNQKTELNC